MHHAHGGVKRKLTDLKVPTNVSVQEPAADVVENGFARYGQAAHVRVKVSTPFAASPVKELAASVKNGFGDNTLCVDEV